MKRLPLLLILATTLSLGGCSALEDLVQEATNWIEDARSENAFDAVDNPQDFGVVDDNEYAGQPTFDDKPANLDEFDDDLFFFQIKDSVRYAIAELDADESEYGAQLYLEFEGSDAFIPLQPDPDNDDQSAGIWAFTAIPNFNQAIEFDVRLNRFTMDGEFLFGDETAMLIGRGSAQNFRVVGINLPGQGDYGFHSEEYPDGNLSN